MRVFAFRLSLFICFIALVPSAFALSFSGDVSAYTDAGSLSQEEAVAVGLLTEEGVLRGNDDGTFRPDALLNRAEFMTVAMRLLPDAEFSVDAPCFPDVAPDIWYAAAVCRAKSLGIVRGNANSHLPESDWLFSPDRPVQYEEVLKVLVRIFSLPADAEPQGNAWFTPYLDTAQNHGLHLESLFPGDQIRRGEMAVLTAKFVAYDGGDLAVLERAMRGEDVMSSSSSSAPAEGRSQDSNASSEHTVDPYGDVSLVSDILLLGEVTPVLASASAFSNTEPVNVTDFLVTLNAVSQSVETFLVYDADRRSLGQATLDSSIAGGKTYRLSVRTTDIQFAKREEYSFYVRARTRGPFAGGVSGEEVQVSSLGIRGTGEWSNSSYASSSSETFPAFQTARSRVTAIENAGESNGALVPGTGLEIGSFRFQGTIGDGQADLRVTDIDFSIASVGNVSVTNVQLGADGTSSRADCTVAGSTVTCAGIDAEFGSFEDRDRVLTLYGDVTVPESSINRSLQISINQPGSVSSAGAVTWTDGDTSFPWVPMGSPVARGTRFE